MTFDWEAEMREVRSRATAAARHGERTLGGVAEALIAIQSQDKHLRYEQGGQSDRSPPWFAESHFAGLSGAAGKPSRSIALPFCAPVERRSRPFRRRRAIRRVFLELIFLRVPLLWARLATLGGRRHALPSSRIADAERPTGKGLGALPQSPLKSRGKAPEIHDR